MIDLYFPYNCNVLIESYLKKKNKIHIERFTLWKMSYKFYLKLFGINHLIKKITLSLFLFFFFSRDFFRFLGESYSSHSFLPFDRLGLLCPGYDDSPSGVAPLAASWPSGVSEGRRLLSWSGEYPLSLLSLLLPGGLLYLRECLSGEWPRLLP